MKIQLNRINQAYHFEAINESGASLHLDANPEIGGENKGFRPMQSLLAALAGCSGIDIGLILKKMKQELRDFKVTVEADRKPVGKANIFDNISIHFDLYGDIDEDKARKAIDLSMDGYCSVAIVLKATANITSSFTIHP